MHGLVDRNEIHFYNCIIINNGKGTSHEHNRSLLVRPSNHRNLGPGTLMQIGNFLYKISEYRLRTVSRYSSTVTTKSFYGYTREDAIKSAEEKGYVVIGE